MVFKGPKPFAMAFDMNMITVYVIKMRTSAFYQINFPFRTHFITYFYAFLGKVVCNLFRIMPNLCIIVPRLITETHFDALILRDKG